MTLITTDNCYGGGFFNLNIWRSRRLRSRFLTTCLKVLRHSNYWLTTRASSPSASTSEESVVLSHVLGLVSTFTYSLNDDSIFERQFDIAAFIILIVVIWQLWSGTLRRVCAVSLFFGDLFNAVASATVLLAISGCKQGNMKKPRPNVQKPGSSRFSECKQQQRCCVVATSSIVPSLRKLAARSKWNHQIAERSVKCLGLQVFEYWSAAALQQRVTDELLSLAAMWRTVTNTFFRQFI